MVKVIFECTERKNEHREEFEFKDDITDKEIEEEFEEWVWNEIADHYYWRRI